MDKPEDEKAGVTIKAMSVTAWKRAREAADKQDQSMAEWLARAINQLADREAGERETFPGNRGNPEPVAPAAPPASWEGIAVLTAGLAAIAEKKGCGGSATRMRAILDQHLAVVALAPIKFPKGVTSVGIGETALISADFAAHEER